MKVLLSFNVVEFIVFRTFPEASLIYPENVYSSVELAFKILTSTRAFSPLAKTFFTDFPNSSFMYTLTEKGTTEKLLNALKLFNSNKYLP